MRLDNVTVFLVKSTQQATGGKQSEHEATNPLKKTTRKPTLEHERNFEKGNILKRLES